METAESKSDLNCSGIYEIRCLPTGKFYIGRTIHFWRRRQWHTVELKEGIHHNILLQRAWDKYGEQAFRFSILEIVKENIVEREQEWLNKHLPFDPEKIFNISEKASGWTSEETTALNVKNWQDASYRVVMKEHLKNANEQYKHKFEHDQEFRIRIINLLKRASKTFTEKRKIADKKRGKKLGKHIADLLQNDPETREKFVTNMRAVQATLTKKQLSDAGKIGAQKAHETMSAFSPEKRSDIAKKGWETRLKNESHNIQ